MEIKTKAFLRTGWSPRSRAALLVGCLVAFSAALAGQREKEPVFRFDLRFLSEGNSIRNVSSPFVTERAQWSIPSGTPSSPVRYVGPLPVVLNIEGSDGQTVPLARLKLNPQESDYLLFVRRNPADGSYAVLPIGGFGKLPENAVLFYNFTDLEILGKLENRTLKVAPKSRSLQNPGELENIAVTLQMAVPHRDSYRRFFARTMPFYPGQRHVILITEHTRTNRLQVSRFSDVISPEPPVQGGSDAARKKEEMEK